MYINQAPAPNTATFKTLVRKFRPEEYSAMHLKASFRDCLKASFDLLKRCSSYSSLTKLLATRIPARLFSTSAFTSATRRRSFLKASVIFFRLVMAYQPIKGIKAKEMIVKGTLIVIR